MEQTMGTLLPLYSIIPFVGMLLSIALLPIFTPNLWHKHFGKISIGWAVLIAVPLIIAYKGEATYEILHILIADYVPFIILLGALFTVSGGILVRTTLNGTPLVNAGFLLVGSLLASWMGTTGAAMLLIRPFLRINKDRKYKAFMVVFFIFTVANVGGSLTPLGDPPLFLGFLHGVPFFWTLNLFAPMMFVLVLLILLYLAFDFYFLSKEKKEGNIKSNAETAVIPQGKKIQFLGVQNLLLIGVIVGAILFSGNVELAEINILGVHVPLQNIIKDIALVLVMFVSLKITPKSLREENEFSWEPIKEVALLFIGIFVTMVPTLAILKAGNDGALSAITSFVQEPAQYFWVTGILSGFLDNAPTYLTFFNTVLGQIYPGIAEPEAVSMLIADNATYLLAISAGSVFFGALSYIGNAPNFMVRSIAEDSGVKMPSFFGYMIYSVIILLPIYVLVTFIWF